MHLGPEDVLLALDAEFRDGVPAEEISGAVNRIERAIRERFPEVGRIYIESRVVSPAAARPESPLAAEPAEQLSPGRRPRPSRPAR